MTSRRHLASGAVALVGLAGALFSAQIPAEEFADTLKSIQDAVHQLQEEIKELQDSFNELQRSGKTREATEPQSALQRAQEAYERGRQAEDRKEYRTAVEAFTEAVGLDPKNDSAFLHRGYSHIFLGDYAQAISDLNQSLALQPNNSRAFAARASALGASGQSGAGLLDANEAIRRDGNNAANYLLRAGLEQQLGRGEDALEDYGKAISLAPDSPDAYLDRAALLRSQGQAQESLADCFNAIRINPALAAAYLCRAQFYLLSGAAEEALEDINRAVRRGPGLVGMQDLLSSAENIVRARRPPESRDLGTNLPRAADQVAQGEDAGASESVSAGLHERENWTADDFYREGRWHSDQQRFELAAEAFHKALLLDPKNAPALNARGYAYLRLRRYEDALADFTDALRWNSSYANAYWNRSAAKRAMGNRTGAREDLRRATDLNRSAQLRATKSSK